LEELGSISMIKMDKGFKANCVIAELYLCILVFDIHSNVECLDLRGLLRPS